jgi:hypothetical protein
MRNYSFYSSTPGTGMGNMAMIQGKFMPSNPNFVGVGANKNFNPYIEGEFMPSNPDFIGVGAPVAGPESNIYSGLKKNYRTNEKLIDDEVNPYPERDQHGREVDPSSVTNIEEEKKKFEKRKQKVEKQKVENQKVENKTSNLNININSRPTEEVEKWEKFMKNREKYGQQVLNQAYLAGGLDRFGDQILQGSKVAAESVVPNMIAGTTGLLASMAQGNKSIAASFGVPISPMQRMGYYS